MENQVDPNIPVSQSVTSTPIPKHHRDTKIIVLAVLFLLAIGINYMALIKGSPVPEPAIVTSEMEDWKTYQNEGWGIEFKYPASEFPIIEDEESVSLVQWENEPHADFINFSKPRILNDEELMPSRRETLDKIALNEYSRLIEYINDGILIEAETISGYHFFTYDKKSKKVVEIVAGSPELWKDKNNTFNQILSTFKFIEPVKSLTLDEQIKNLKVGDILNSMKVVYIKQLLNRSDLPIGEDNAKIGFSGQVTISGEYYDNSSNEGFPSDQICFRTKGVIGSSKFPFHAQDAFPWFCFNDTTKAKQLLGQSVEGKATVMIDNYVSKHCGCEAVNEADLVQVISKD